MRIAVASEGLAVSPYFGHCASFTCYRIERGIIVECQNMPNPHQTPARIAAVLALAQAWRVPVHFYSAQQLEQVTGDFPRSDFVRRITGTDNVCQRAAAKASENGSCLLAKTAKDGMTVSIYAKEWRAEF